MSCIIYSINWAVVTICEHVKPKEALASATVGVGVEEALEDGVVISALEVVEARLRIVVITTVAQRVHICQAARGTQNRAVGVIFVLRDRLAGRVDQIQYVALKIEQIIEWNSEGSIRVHRSQIQHIRSAALVVEEIQSILRTIIRVGLPQQLTGGIGVIVPDTVHDLIGAQAVHVIIISDGIIQSGDGSLIDC